MKLRFKLFIFTLLSVLVLASATTFAEGTPPANAEIGNQATLEYVTGTGESRTVLSNIVITTVASVYGVDIDPDIHLYGIQGDAVYYVHTVTNIGNDVDDIRVSVANYADVGDTYDEGEVAIGVYGPTGLDFTFNGTFEDVAPGASEGVIVRMVGTAANQDQGDFNVIATSVKDTTKTDLVTDNLTLSAAAIVNAYKGFSDGNGNTVSSGETGQPFMATFYFHNTGGSQSGEISLVDTLEEEFEVLDNMDATVSYIAGGAGTGNFANADEKVISWNGAANHGVTIALDDSGDNDVVTITRTEGIHNVTPNPLITLDDMIMKVSFWIQVKDGTPAQTIPNTGIYSYYDGPVQGSATQIQNIRTNVVYYTILRNFGVTFVGEDLGVVEQGSLIAFKNVITNLGNAPDTFNITFGEDEFPAGTDFFLAHDTDEPVDFDQRVPLIDTNSDEVLDTGIMEVGEQMIILLWAQLPAEAIGEDFKLQKIGTSIDDEETTATATDIVDVRAVEVDITNNRYIDEGNNSNIGMGRGPEVSPVTQIDILPGGEGYFNLYINNTATELTDEYTLEVSSDPTFETIGLPEGIEITLETPQGAQISGTGPIAPLGHFNARAVVSVASDALAGNLSIYFRARSAATGAYDIKHDMIKIGILRNLSIIPNNTGTTYAGSYITYSHTVRNGGNVLEGGGSSSSIVLLKPRDTRSNHFSSTIYWDKDENGVLEKGIDPQLADLSIPDIGGLAPGEAIDIFVEVYAFLTAKPTFTNTTNIRLDVSKGVYNVNHPDVFAEDITTIIEDNLTIEKYQSTAASPNWAAENPANFTKERQEAAPEDYIFYKLVVTNTGTTDVDDVMIEDIIPQYTTLFYEETDALPGLSSMPSYRLAHENEFKIAEVQPGNGERGIVEADIGTLEAGQSAELYFTVKIDGVKNPVAD